MVFLSRNRLFLDEIKVISKIEVEPTIATLIFASFLSSRSLTFLAASSIFFAFCFLTSSSEEDPIFLTLSVIAFMPVLIRSPNVFLRGEIIEVSIFLKISKMFSKKFPTFLY